MKTDDNRAVASSSFVRDLVVGEQFRFPDRPASAPLYTLLELSPLRVAREWPNGERDITVLAKRVRAWPCIRVPNVELSDRHE